MYPAGAIYVGRGTVFGNPFRIGGRAPDGGVMDRERVIEEYRVWLEMHPELKERARRELRGRDLLCWCAPEACHADVLLEVANGPVEGSSIGTYARIDMPSGPRLGDHLP
jgi:hypothetical protein